MVLYHYEMALNDLYQHLLQNSPEKGTKMIDYAKRFIDNKDYRDGFWFEMNMGYDKVFKNEYIKLIEQVKKDHAHLWRVCERSEPVLFM